MLRSAPFPMIFCILLAQAAFGQNASRTVSGLLTSAEDGTPLEGVRVIAKGSGLITGTMQDGMFYLPVTDKDSCLLLSREDILPTKVRLTSAMDYSVKLHTGLDRRWLMAPIIFFACGNFQIQHILFGR